MQHPTARAWVDGALYFLMFVVGSLVAMADELPLVRAYRSEMAIAGILLTGIKAFMNRSIAEMAMRALPAREQDPHDLVDQMPGVAETMRSALGDVPSSRSAPLPAGPNQLAHLGDIADGIRDVSRLARNFGPAGGGDNPHTDRPITMSDIPPAIVPANARSQQDADGRWMVDNQAAEARARADALRREEADRIAAQDAQRARDIEAAATARRKSEIADLEAKLSALREISGTGGG